MERDKVEKFINEKFGADCMGYVIHQDTRKVSLTCMQHGKEKYYEISFEEIEE